MSTRTLDQLRLPVTGGWRRPKLQTVPYLP